MAKAGFVISDDSSNEQASEVPAQNNNYGYYYYPATKVNVDLSFTRNLGNYESIKINIGVEDCVRDGENVNSATERVYKFVEDKLIEKTREMEEELKRGK